MPCSWWRLCQAAATGPHLTNASTPTLGKEYAGGHDAGRRPLARDCSPPRCTQRSSSPSLPVPAVDATTRYNHSNCDACLRRRRRHSTTDVACAAADRQSRTQISGASSSFLLRSGTSCELFIRPRLRRPDLLHRLVTGLPTSRPPRHMRCARLRRVFRLISLVLPRFVAPLVRRIVGSHQSSACVDAPPGGIHPCFH